RSDDFHRLLMGDAQMANDFVRVQRDAEIIQNALRLADHGSGSKQDAGGFAAEKDVFGHGEVGNQCEFLIYDADALMANRSGIAEPERLSIDRHVTGVWRNRA